MHPSEAVELKARSGQRLRVAWRGGAGSALYATCCSSRPVTAAELHGLHYTMQILILAREGLAGLAGGPGGGGGSYASLHKRSNPARLGSGSPRLGSHASGASRGRGRLVAVGWRGSTNGSAATDSIRGMLPLLPVLAALREAAGQPGGDGSSGVPRSRCRAAVPECTHFLGRLMWWSSPAFLSVVAVALQRDRGAVLGGYSQGDPHSK